MMCRVPRAAESAREAPRDACAIERVAKAHERGANAVYRGVLAAAICDPQV